MSFNLKNSQITDPTTGLTRSEFWEQFSDSATITKRTFYSRILSGKYSDFKEALTASKSNSTINNDVESESELIESIDTIDSINDEASENFFDQFVNNEDSTLSFGDKKIKAPIGA